MRNLAGMVARLITLFAAAVLAPFALAAAASDTDTSGGSENPGRNLVGHGGPVRGLDMAADGKRALSASFDYAAMYWDLTARPPEALTRLIGHDGPVNDVIFLSENRALTGSDDASLALWDLDSGEMLRRFHGHQAKVVDVTVSPDGKFAASASWDRTVGLWRISDGEMIAQLTGHSGPVNAVAFSDDGEHLYSGSADGSIRLWSADGSDKRPIRPVINYGWGINAMRLLSDERIVFGSQNGDVRVIGTDGEEIKVLAPHDGPVLSLALSPEGDILASGGSDGVIRLWQTEAWAPGETYNNPTGPVWALDFMTRGELYYGGLDDFVVYWSADPREPFETIPSDYPRRFQVDSEMSLGERQFARKCSICHTLTPDDANRAGPTLHGLFGREAGTLPDYPYSNALVDSDIIWNEETVARLFEEGPDVVTPGTKMPIQRLREEDDLAALVAFLKRATKPESGAEPE